MGDLVSDVKAIKEFVSELKEEEVKKKQKKFKFPWGKKTSSRQAKKGWVTIVKLMDNNQVNFVKERIEEQTVMADGIPRLATPKHIWNFGKNPVMFLPNYSVEPLSRENIPEEGIENEAIHKKAEERNTLTTGFKILLARVRTAGLENKKTFPTWIKWVLGLGIVGVIVWAVVSGGTG